MASVHAPAPTHPSQALGGVLRSKGFELADFEFDEDPAPAWYEFLGARSGLLRVHCHSTGEERLYPTGSGSAWLGAFLMDLGGGHFSGAARGARAALA